MNAKSDQVSPEAAEPVQRKKPLGRRILKVLGIVAIVVAAGAALFLGASAIASSLYWGAGYDGIELDTSTYAEDAAWLWDEYDEQDEELFSVVDQATEIPDEYLDQIETCNGYIETYFSEVWDIDVSGLIDSVEVHELDFTLAGDGYESLCGMADPDDGNVYISCEMVEPDGLWYGDDTWFVDCYVHEMVHVLGSCEQPDNEMVYLFEGLTEYITGLILTYNGFDYVNGSSYSYNTAIAGQIIQADDSIIPAIIGHYGEFDLKDWVDERTDGYADELENMLFLTLFGGYSDTDLLVRAQYIAAEYCKNVNPEDAEEIVTADPAVSFFELRCLLAGLS